MNLITMDVAKSLCRRKLHGDTPASLARDIDSNFSRHKRGLVADHLTFNRTKPSYPEQYRQQYTPIRLAPATSVFRSRGQLGDALNIIIGSGHHVTGRFFGNSFPTFCALQT